MGAAAGKDNMQVQLTAGPQGRTPKSLQCARCQRVSHQFENMSLIQLHDAGEDYLRDTQALLLRASLLQHDMVQRSAAPSALRGLRSGHPGPSERRFGGDHPLQNVMLQDVMGGPRGMGSYV